ncbi:DUF4365 domain-containing protein [Verrucomicrobiales bacterium BCK34]|nr:DUF4365 domain-containing protein [Verrucomicrobiales bacterium BCK34]
MGSRPREHQLEDESVVYFRSILPSEWVYREESHDYGIDGSVECFDPGGKSTGIRCYVQLKATDSEDPKVQKKAKFKVSTLEYWHSHDIPTLIVRYSSIARCVYWNWHFDRRIALSRSGKSASIKYGNEDLWLDDTPGSVFLRLERLRRLRRSSIRPPIAISFESERGSEIDDIRDNLREPMALFSRLVTYEDRRLEADGAKLHLADSELIVDLEGCSTAPIANDQSNLKKLAADIIVGTAVCYASVGQHRIALELLQDSFAHAEYHASRDGAFLLGNSITHERDFDLLQSVAIDLLDRNLDRFGFDFMLFAPLGILHTLRDDELQKYIRLVSQITKRSIQTKDKRAGRYAYNLAEIFSKLGWLREAVRYYRIAGQMDETYLEKDYFFIQAGGACYRAGRYKAAAFCYLRSMRLSEHVVSSSAALLGETQIQRGNFGSAVFWLRKALESKSLMDDPRFPNFSATYQSATRLRARFGARVERQTSRSFGNLDSVRKSGKAYSEEDLCMAIEQDPLNVYAWNELGCFYAESGNPENAIEPFFVAASLSDGNLCYWLNILTLSFSLRLPFDVCVRTLSAAITYGHDRLAKAAHERAKKSEEGEREALRRIGDLLATMPSIERPVAFRIIKE